MLDEKDAGNIRTIMYLLRVAWVAELGMMVAMAAVAHVVRPKIIESNKADTGE